MSLPNSLFSTTLLPKPQFRAVVTCGFGSDLYPLVEPVSANSDDDYDTANNSALEPNAPPQHSHHAASSKLGQTKGLLPVAGKKMIDWVLERVEEAGVFDIIVLSPTSIASPMAHHLRARRSSPSTSSSSSPAAKVELEEVPESIARRGTVQILRWAADKGLIKTDFILLPCDLLFSPSNNNAVINLATLLDRHRTDDNLMTTLFSERAAGGVVEARKDGPPEIMTIYDRKTSTLLDVRETDEYEDEIPIRTSLLARFPSPTLSTTLLPTQLYVFSQAVLPLLLAEEHARRLRHMENFRELAGWICRLSWRNKGRDAVGYRSKFDLEREDGLAMGRSTTQKPHAHAGQDAGPADRGRGGDAGSMPHTGANTPALVSRGSWTARAGSVDFANGNSWTQQGGTLSGTGLSGSPATMASKHAASGGCKVVIWTAQDGWCGRGNTVAGWVEMNRAALKLLPPQPPPTNTPSGVFISPDSFLHPSVYPNLGEKVGIKRCIIGKSCFVGKGSKLTNAVIMDNVVIGENVKLDNCVISNGVQIRDRATLKDVDLGRNVIIDTDAQLKNEQLVVEID